MFDNMLKLAEALKQSGAVSRPELEVTTDNSPMDPKHRLEMESIVYSATPSRHRFTENGKFGIVYFDVRGRAVSSFLTDIPSGELIRLAQKTGWNPSADLGYQAPEQG